jgi:hypothetical protein
LKITFILLCSKQAMLGDQKKFYGNSEHCRGTSDSAFHSNSIEGTVELASSALHTSRRLNKADNTPILGKYGMGANIYTYTTTGA